MPRRQHSMLAQRVTQEELDLGVDAHSRHVEKSHKVAAGGLALTASQMVDIHELHPSPYNDVFEEAKGDDYWTRLRQDIEETGAITDPLIAKRDGTLISGHSRLRITTELFESGRVEFAKVPVRYVRAEITKEDEQRRVILSNLLRFDIPHEMRILLESQVYPDYFESPKNGRPRSDEPPRSTSASIAKETGQSPESVRKKRKVFSEAKKLAKERGVDSPEVSDIRAAKKARNETRRKKAKAQESVATIAEEDASLTQISVQMLRDLVPEFCEDREDDQTDEVLYAFVRFVELRVRSLAQQSGS
jgi:hypothetical protein